MVARLGNVLYWAACVLAVGWLAFWLYAIRMNGGRGDTGLGLAVTFGGAAVIWLIARATRYVLTGK
jgi:hypothetical protein